MKCVRCKKDVRVYSTCAGCGGELCGDCRRNTKYGISCSAACTRWLRKTKVKRLRWN